MILLPLPDNLREHIKNKIFKTFENCDFQFQTGIVLLRPSTTAERTNDNVNTFDCLNELPSIDNLLPTDIIPTLIMEDENLATQFKTESLEKL
jgi:hypothetical protein